jgi:hypothetical protein
LFSAFSGSRCLFFCFFNIASFVVRVLLLSAIQRQGKNLFRGTFPFRSRGFPFGYFFVNPPFYSIKICVPFPIHIRPIDIKPILSFQESSICTHVRRVIIWIFCPCFLSVLPILFLRCIYFSVSQYRRDDNPIFYSRKVNLSLRCQLPFSLYERYRMAVFTFVPFDIPLATEPQNDSAFPFERGFVFGMCVILEPTNEAYPVESSFVGGDLNEVADFVVCSVVGGGEVLDGIGLFGFGVGVDVRDSICPFPFWFRFRFDCFVVLEFPCLCLLPPRGHFPSHFPS